VMPSANSARSHSLGKKVFRRLAALIFTFGVLVLLVAIVLAFPRQKPCNPACVVLIGDSITSKRQSLAPAKQLSGLQIINRGIPSDSTSHMLSRFNRDVVQFHPRVVVTLGGINDNRTFVQRKQLRFVDIETRIGNGIRIVNHYSDFFSATLLIGHPIKDYRYLLDADSLAATRCSLSHCPLFYSFVQKTR